MLKNYLLVALRTFRRQKGYSAINVVGLTLGLACCLLIFQYVAYERSFDAFNAHADDLYRVALTTARNGAAPEAQATTGHAMAPALAQAVPEVVRFARLHPDFTHPVIANPAQPERVFEEAHVDYADPAFLQMFSVPLVAGDTAKALAEPGTLLLSESSARKYFGDADPIGQVLDVTGWISGAFRVNGVFRDVPANSSFPFDILLPMGDLLQRSDYRDPTSGWTWNNFATFLQLRPGADRAEVERKLTAVLMQHRGDTFREQGITAHLGAQPLRDVHLNEAIKDPTTVMGSRRTVYFFTLIGLVTLLIALVNYVNLATARALDRAREVGVRKALGAERSQLVVQFLFESALTNLVAIGCAIGLAALLRPAVGHLVGTALPASLWTSLGFWGAFLATFAVGTLLAGLYPAFVLSSFRPVAALRGSGGTGGSRPWLRRGLVVLQLATSVVLIGGTTVVYQQLRYMRTMDLGLDLTQVLTVPAPRVLPEGVDDAHAVGTMMEALRRVPSVQQVASSGSVPGQGFDWYTSGVRKATDDPTTNVQGVVTHADTSFARLYGLRLVAGAGFDGASAAQPEGVPLPVLASETAVRALGFDVAADAVGQAINVGARAATIVGVLKDFGWSSAHEKRENIFLAPTQAGSVLSLKVSTADLPRTLAAVEKTYTGLYPGNPFTYAFADETFDRQYRDDRRFAALFTLFAGLAIFIACLGLLGLAAFTAEQRRKEIGVRKVLGASVPTLVALLSRDFVRLAVLAFVVAAPLAYYAMSRWLDGFAYRITLGPGAFLLAGALATLIALLTVSTQALRAATADPVKALRSE